MGVTLPTFNLLADVWENGTSPFSDPPAYTNLPCQKYISPKGVSSLGVTNWTSAYNPVIELRFDPTFWPYNLDDFTSWSAMIVQVPPSSGACYFAFWWDTMHRGFPNEYPVLFCNQCLSNGQVFVPTWQAKFPGDPADFPP